MYRGEIWWAQLPDQIGSEPGYRRPVLIIQSCDRTSANPPYFNSINKRCNSPQAA
ncbi:type II toxin-antitoxin system PemK/MazF family toxin [Aerosakkonema sp. BLCC-F183]|uniref:type II toxin-antitoxin system PemK/MazF family toxin n=1 Tax=Aerosakkonema sp. BLCC-F183 TaxID=3342834 RepID=UPI0035BA76DD